ncbi:LysR family transcriptional regulator [Mesorhizobium sp. M6A.T.Ce.TU.002.03.1.1]|uniref:LysR family transcriptional regulator n=1 Tax=unclassified Mesorhizobium TaxID=325217 RepID=UPI000FCC121E|nr:MULTISPECIES: LysR family transcriptional regulator [unclassified Mesorhizobium]RUU28950.1 LysR family transcriptional regulator [Mesorhizobium sp. M6A.T.Ce.TU.016.01.1.1]RUU46386.1 LysR family transcriptional regulator [Mesorhizobium sp. M6A.T.Ce.TU.002.03.1.1]RUU99189.1 LysR family transcriptional regulator [Mesorhizobium sp. M6A.T.Cr.TU.017.01.1.1]RWN65883.1 MAG: LysR family transcriptional regulator [Mesorhizobium sp.]RWP51599.1 MAG: LysR family transcriptional regulator [Mesorhizobium 
MDRDLLSHLPVVVAVARRGGFALAAAELGMSPSAVSHAVRLVEERIGQPLFARTTRSVALTEAGEALVAAAEPALEDIADRMERIRSVKGRASGLLRINAPRIALPLALMPILSAMAERYPDVTVEIVTDERLSDIVGEGFDAGIRLGEMIAEDMVTVRLTQPFRTIVVASPAYVGRHGQPRTLADLSAHNCIGYRLLRSRALYRWDLNDQGKDISVETRGSVVLTDPLSARDMALAGIGLAYLFEPLVRADVEAGRLVEVLRDTSIDEPGLFLYFPRRAAMAPKLRAFIDTAQEIGRASSRTPGRKVFSER